MLSTKVDVFIGCKVQNRFNRVMLKYDVYNEGISMVHKILYLPIYGKYNSHAMCINVRKIVRKQVNKICLERNMKPYSINFIWIYGWNTLRYDNVIFPDMDIVHDYISSVLDGYEIQPYNLHGKFMMPITFGFDQSQIKNIAENFFS